MRFRKGNKVEVLRMRDGPAGSWWCAEIISGNGHYYKVRYDQTPDGESTERVSRKAMRPLPPGGMSNWDSGDIVEFFDNYSWKIAKVVELVERSFYLVRPLGSPKKLCIHRSNLRVRQSWQNDMWILIGKDSHQSTDRKVEKTLPEKNNQMNCSVPLQVREEGALQAVNPTTQENFDPEEKFHFEPPHRRKKRKLEQPMVYISTKKGSHKRVGTVDLGGSCQLSVWKGQSELLEKVDAVASQQKFLGKKYMHDSFNNRITRSEMNAEENRNFAANMGCMRHSESSDAENSACSVASCHVNENGPDGMLYTPRERPRHDSYSDDAESSSDGWESRKVSTSLLKDELAAEIHNLELHAYRSTLEALYASGPLSWEQEETMTNLRLSLNISNDEHLMELKNLVSGS